MNENIETKELREMMYQLLKKTIDNTNKILYLEKQEEKDKEEIEKRLENNAAIFHEIHLHIDNSKKEGKMLKEAMEVCAKLTTKYQKTREENLLESKRELVKSLIHDFFQDLEQPRSKFLNRY